MTNQVLVIVGPTAVGKTKLSLSLAARFSGEIISADSRLFYRGMDIGTDKPTEEERALIRHHLIDIRQPVDTITLGEYQRLAYTAITEIQGRGHLPILVGGTGQYIKAVVEGWGIPPIPPNPELRNQLSKMDGSDLVRWLDCLDPISASRIHPRNIRRIIRALEVILISGLRMSELQIKAPPGYSILTIGLTCDRGILYQRTDARIDGMVADGLVEEVANLRNAGYGRDLPALSGLGYAQIYAHLEGEIALDEAVQRTKFETHRFVRQQFTWFRPGDSTIHWFRTEGQRWQEEIELLVATSLTEI